jgi:hypothetical protein
VQLSFQHGSPTVAPGSSAQRIRLAHAKANTDGNRSDKGIGQVAQQPSTTGTIAAFAAAGSSTTVGILAALSAASGNSGSGSGSSGGGSGGGSNANVAGGIGLAITGLITIASLIYKAFQGCGQTCVEATDIANQVEPVLLQNLQQYLAAPIHYASLQAAALNNFNTAWQGLVQGCGSGALATTQAGENCIANRQQGSCAYKTSPGGWQQDASGNWSYVYPGANGSGTACWDWFIGYHDPIANDPTVVPDPVAGASSSSASASSSTTGTAAGSFPWPLLIVAAVVAWAMEEA